MLLACIAFTGNVSREKWKMPFARSSDLIGGVNGAFSMGGTGDSRPTTRGLQLDRFVAFGRAGVLGLDLPAI